MTLTTLDLFLRVCFVGFSGILFVVSVMAYRRNKSARLALVSLSFALFLFMSALVLSSSFLGWRDLEMSAVLVILNLAILVALYIALLKR